MGSLPPEGRRGPAPAGRTPCGAPQARRGFDRGGGASTLTPGRPRPGTWTPRGCARGPRAPPRAAAAPGTSGRKQSAALAARRCAARAFLRFRPSARAARLRLRRGRTPSRARPLPVRREGRRDGSPWRSEVCCCRRCRRRGEPVPRRRPCPRRLPRAPGPWPPGPSAGVGEEPAERTCAPTRALHDPVSRLRGRGARGAVATPRRVSPGGAAGPGLLQPPGCARELSSPLPCCPCHDWSRLSPTAGSASAPAGPLVEPPGRAPPGM